MTAQTLIYTALRIAGYTRTGVTNSSAALADGLAALNALIDASNINRGNIYTERLDTWTLVAGTQAYTIGASGAVFTATRPVRIERANVLLATGGATVRLPLDLLDDNQWLAKTFQAVRSIPRQLYNDEAFPVSTYFFYPIPDQAYQIETLTWQQFAPIATLATAIAVPPGFLDFWTYSLAMRLAPMFGQAVTPALLQLFTEARAAVMALNAISPRLRSDSDTGAGGGRVDFRTGLTIDF